VVVVCALIGLGIGMLYQSLRPERFEAETFLSVENPIGPLVEEAALATSPTVLIPAESVLGFKPDVKVTGDDATQLLTVTASSVDPEEATKAANVVAASYAQAQLGAPASIAQVADVPTSPVGRGVRTWGFLGALAGAAFGSFINFMRGFSPGARPAKPRRAARRSAPAPAPTQDFIAREAGLGNLLGSPESDIDWEPLEERAAAGYSTLPLPSNPLSSGPLSSGPLAVPAMSTATATLVAPPLAEKSVAVTPSESETSQPVAEPVSQPVAEPVPEPVPVAAAASKTEPPAPPTAPDSPAALSVTAAPAMPAQLELPPPLTDELIIDLSVNDFEAQIMPVQPKRPERGSSFSELSGVTELSPKTRRAAERSTSLWSPPIDMPDPDPVAAPEAPAQASSGPVTSAVRARHTEQPTRTSMLDRAAFRMPAPEPVVEAVPESTPVPESQTPAEVKQAASTTPGAGTESQPPPPASDATPSADAPPPAEAQPRDDAGPDLQPILTVDTGLAAVEEITDATPEPLRRLDREAMQTRFETQIYEQSLAHKEELAHLRTEHEQHTAALQAEVASLNKQLTVQSARMKTRSGTELERVGDLEAQLASVEMELSEARDTLETERINHAKRLNEERNAADRSLDNARRQFRSELAKHTHTHRTTLADHRSELDRELSQDRSEHAAQLERAHAKYEAQLEVERSRADELATANVKRHERTQQDLADKHARKLEQISEQHKETVATLRTSADERDRQIHRLEADNKALRGDVQAQRKMSHDMQVESQTSRQRLSDELDLVRQELAGERQRNAALRSDVVRRSAEAHQEIDRAVEERNAQLAELEATVERQRDYAEARVREISASAEDKAREASVREANLTATISRLKRELDEAKKANR